MKTLKDLLTHLKNNNINIFLSTKPGVMCISGRHKDLVDKVDEIHERDFEFWESFYNEKWTTFIKNPEKSISNKEYNTDRYNDYDGHVELCDAFSYDEICCDPDLQEHWESKYGPGDPVFNEYDPDRNF